MPASLLAISGGFTITVKNPDGQSAGAPAPEFVDPVLSSISPSMIPAGSPATAITATGMGFAPTNTVTVAGTPFPTTYVSSTVLRVAVPASMLATNASILLMVKDSSGATSSTQVLSVPAPTITSINPTSAAAGGPGFTVTINGSGFVPGTTVEWNGAALASTVVSAVQIRAQVPAALFSSAGAAVILVLGPGGATASASFTILPPRTPLISSVTPGSINAGQPATTLSVSSTGIVDGCTVNWGGTPLSTASAGSGQLSAVVPANLLDLSGAFNITVTNPDGSVSPAVREVVNPVLEALNLTRSADGSTMTFTAVGLGFVSTDVIWASVSGTSEALPTAFVSSSTLTAHFPAVDLANGPVFWVDVFDAGANVNSQQNQFNVNAQAPAISAVTPPYVPVGGAGLTLTITGSGFDVSPVVLWNGMPLPTDVSAPGQLSATIPAALVAAAGTAAITVMNGDGVASNQVPFTIGTPQPVFTTAGVVNFASGLTSIAPGSLIAIYGSSLSAGTAQASNLPLPASLGTTSVLVNGTPAPLLYVSPSQINAQVPWDTPSGTATLLVQNGATSEAATITVSPTGPGVITYPSPSHALAVNLSDDSLNSAQHAAAPGQYVLVYVTGQGAVSPSIRDGAGAPNDALCYPIADVEVSIGGQPATVQFAGMAPGYVGLMQVNISVPNVASGDQTLAISVGGVAANATLLSVGPTQ